MKYSFKKIIEYGLYILVFLLPWQTRWIIRSGEINSGYNEYLSLSLYGTDILLAILLGLFIVFQITNNKQQTTNEEKDATKPKNVIRCSLFVTRVWWFIAALDLLMFISIFYSIDKAAAVERYLWFLLGVGLFWLITQANYDRWKLVCAFLGGAFLQAFFGIWQFLAQSSFADKWLGLSEHAAEAGGSSVIEILAGGRWLRAYGSLDHPNILGGYMAISLFLLIIAKQIKFPSSKFQFPNNFNFFSSSFFKITIYYLLFIVFLTALFFSFSRSAFLGLVLGISTLIFILIKKKDIKGLKEAWKISVAGAVLFLLLINIVPDLAATRILGGERLEIKSSIERLSGYEEGWRVIRENWFWGVGAGNYTQYIYKKSQYESQYEFTNDNPNITNNDYPNITNVQSEFTNSKEVIPAWEFQPVHNVFLLIWAEIGILGLILFLLILFYFLRNSLFVIRYSLLAVLLPIFFFDHWLWSLHFGSMLFWVVLGLVYNKQYSIAS